MEEEIEVLCKCGQKLDPKWRICPKCKEPVFYEEKKEQLEKEKRTEEKKEDKNVYIIDYMWAIVLVLVIGFIASCLFIWEVIKVISTIDG
ncbi:MAG: hypothetical protein E7160_01970 [Firmicutes bacterium]|nr:hypothetical protein [Bacillota bacterium]